MRKSKALRIVIIVIAAVVFLLAASGWVHFAVMYSEIQTDKSYLSTDGEVEKILRGILINNSALADGESCGITYDFDCEEYATLESRYNIKQLAGDGSELDKGLRLMHAFAPRLAHGGSFNDDNIGMNSLELLEYCLDKPEHTINCRCKAQIFGEMCLSLGIYARKVWIMPYSSLDDECHVVTEIFDTSYNKWIMLDFTNELYFTDENSTPLSVTEIRQGLISNTKIRYMTTKSGTSTQIPDSDITANRLYYLKNTAYFSASVSNGFGERNGKYYLIPANSSEEFRSAAVGDSGIITSADSFNAAPVI